MTKFRRLYNLLMGLVMMAMAVLLVRDPVGGLTIVAAIISIILSLNGVRSLLYYFTMAKHMVGGRTLLYRGIIYLELGAVTAAMSENPAPYIIIYLAFLHAFNGVIALMRAREARGLGAPQWKFTLLHGITDVAIAAALLFTGFSMRRPDITVYVYAAGLFYSAILRMISAFRRTAIVYIQ